ncbi:MAG TPA: hypothetical protein VF911_00665 [Thermoanaerobaculia bacterium]|jgi:hypothetical protein
MPDENGWQAAGSMILKILGGLLLAAVVLFGLVILTCGGMLVFS